MSEDIRERLQKSVDATSEEYWGYFCYEDNWCESADQSSEPCDCTACRDEAEAEEWDEVQCTCGLCEAHHGSLLDVDITRGADGTMRGIIAIVGIGGPRIELDTRNQRINGYWGNAEARARVNKDTCDRVEQFFDELGM